LLGTLEVVGDDGRPVEIGGAQPRVVLALLVAEAGRAVATDTLLDAVWGDEPPASAAGTLQSYVSRLRRTLAAVGATIEREPAGYRLVIDPEQLDVHRFEALADRGRAALDAGDAGAARELLVEAAGMWRGPALLEVRDRLQASGLARRLDERRLAALEDRLTADLALGRHAAVVGELAQLVTEHPLREGLWALLATARYRAGQQADALRAIADARHTLVEELGVEPGPRLREIEAAILAQDTVLDLAPVPPAAGAASGVVATASTPIDRAPIVGRQTELAVVRQVLDDVAAGAACVVVVQGEAGVGKTRLVEELAAQATGAGARVVWGRSLEGGAAPAYWPWLGVLRPLREDRPERADDAVDQLLDATGALSTAPASAERPPLLDGVLRLLAPEEATGPVVVVFEDVQWAGPESLELLAQVIAGLEQGPVLVVLTLREGEDAAKGPVVSALAAASRRVGTRRLRLEGLDADDTEVLLGQVHGRPLDGAVAQVVHERAEGNPFYAIELVRLLESEGMADDADLARRAVPVGVLDVVRQRLAALPSDTVELLQLAAVAGREVDVALLGRASGRSIDACLDDLDVAVAHRLLVPSGPSGELQFSHALVREVVVDDLSALRRARAHLRVADAIEASGRGDDVAEILAEHLWAAAPIGVGRRAADALDRAAEVAIRRFAVRAAVHLLERSLELRRAAGSDDEAAMAELDTLSTLVWVLRVQRGYPGGMEHYGRGAELARRLGRWDAELEMLWAEWAGYDTACDFDRGRPIAEAFRARAVGSRDALEQMVGFTTWAIQCWHDGDVTGAYEAFTAAEEAWAVLAVSPGERSLAVEIHALSTGFRLYVG
jgi:DNA-binding SARP family transcriptional activator